MPKAKSDQVITHRIEFQETERDALEMVAASITARNVTASVNNLVSPFTQSTTAGAVMAISLLSTIGFVFISEVGLLGPHPYRETAEFTLNPGAWFGRYIAKNSDTIQNFSNEFDKRMRDFNPPSI